MERPLEFNQALERAVLEESKHLVRVEDYSQAADNVKWAFRRITEFLDTNTLAEIRNYLFLINNPSVLTDKNISDEARGRFLNVRTKTVTGFALYGVIDKALPKTDYISEWPDFERVNSLRATLQQTYSGIENETANFTEIARKDEDLVRLIFKN